MITRFRLRIRRNRSCRKQVHWRPAIKQAFVFILSLGLLTGCSEDQIKALEEEDEPCVITADVSLLGGSGKASIESPVDIMTEGDEMRAVITWSSPNYDYMVVNGEKLYPINTEGNSSFEITVPVLDEPFTVIADTVAMSRPHEIEYEITFHTDGAYDISEEKDAGALGKKTYDADSWIEENLSFKAEFKLEYAKKYSADLISLETCAIWRLISCAALSSTKVILETVTDTRL